MKRITDCWGLAFFLAVMIHIAVLAFIGRGALGEAALESKAEYLEVELAAAPPVKASMPQQAEPIKANSPKVTSNNAADAGGTPVTSRVIAAVEQNITAIAAVSRPGQFTEMDSGSLGTPPGDGVAEAKNGIGTGSSSVQSQPNIEQEVDSRPYAVYSPFPEYPSEARLNKWQGRVIVRVLVEASGKVANAQVAQSSGYDALDQAAEEVLYSWRFSPGYRDGRAVATWVKVPVSFKLTR